jgi:protoporphyrinogen oxidase
MKAIVVGAGFAGLTAGYRLKQAGWEIVLLEAADYVGGRVASIRKGGYVIELGATTLSSGFTAYNQLSGELGLDHEVVPASSLICLMRAGRLYPIDALRPGSALFSGALGVRSKIALLRAAKDYMGLTPRMDPLDVSACFEYDVESAKAYAERRLTREIYDVLVDPLIRTYTLRRADEVSCVEWFSVLANLIGQRMMSLRGGLQRMPLALAKSLDVRLNSPVTTVSRSPDGIQVDYRGSSGDQCSEHADACVIATRLPEAAAIFPEFGEKASALIRKLPYNKALCVHLGYRVRTVSRTMGVLVPTIEHEQIALLWCDHSKNEELAASGRSLILAHFDAAIIDQYYDQDDEALARIGQEFVERLFPELRGYRDMVYVSRVPLAIPNPTTGAYAAVHALKASLDPHDRVQFAGDYFTCTGQNSAIHYGNLAARNISSSPLIRERANAAASAT